jgi:hypothetical protein
MARHVESNGKQAVLITTWGYSKTTAKQLGLVRQVCDSLGIVAFHVPCIQEVIPDYVLFNIGYYRDECRRLQGLASRARKHADWYNRQLRDTCVEAKEYASFFGYGDIQSFNDILKGLESNGVR